MTCYLTDDGRVTLDKQKYNELIRDQALLVSLDAAGVDNWEGYGEAMRIFFKSNPEDDMV